MPPASLEIGGNSYTATNYRSRMSDEGLIAHTRGHLKREARLDLELIDDLRELHARKLYLAYGYPSFHEFCTKELGMSDDSAWRRIKAASLVDQFPDVVKPLIAERKVHLTGLALLSRVITPENGERLIQEAASKSTTEIKGMVAREAPEQFASGVRKRPVKQMAEDSWRFTGNLDAYGKSVLDECKDLANERSDDAILLGALEAYRDELRVRKQKALKRRPHLNPLAARQPHITVAALAGAAASIPRKAQRVPQPRTSAESMNEERRSEPAREASSAGSGERAASSKTARPEVQQGARRRPSRALRNDAARNGASDWSEALAGSPREQTDESGSAETASAATKAPIGLQPVVVVRAHLRRQPVFAFETRAVYSARYRPQYAASMRRAQRVAIAERRKL